MGAHLVLRTEGHEETIVSLAKLPLVLGRGREVDLTLASPLVSRRHCELYEADGQICVRDLESLNGTFVGEDRIEDTQLSSGDLLTVGAAIFEVVLEGAEAEKGSGETESEEATELDAAAFVSADDDPTEEVGEVSFDFDGADEEPAPTSDKELPTIHLDKNQSAASVDEDDDLDDFLKHFE